MKRKFKVVCEGRDNCAGIPVVFVYRGEEFMDVVGDWGRTSLDYPHSWVDKIIVNNQVVAENKDVGSKEDLGVFRVKQKTSEDNSKKDDKGINFKLLGKDISNANIVFSYQGMDIQAVTDNYGQGFIRYPYSWVDRILVDGRIVKTDVDLSSFTGKRKHFEIDLGKSGDRNELSSRSKSESQTGIRGQLFYHDGTMCFEEKEVKVWIKEKVFSARSGSDGTFHIDIQTDRLDGSFSREEKFYISKMFVDGYNISAGRRARDYENFYHIIMPKDVKLLGGKSNRGGLIAGQVVDGKGLALADVKISGRIASTSFFSLGDETFSTRSNGKGKFVLRFEGGTRIKKLYVGGDEPRSIKNSKGDEFKNQDLEAGLFDLSLTRKDRFFGLF